MRWPAQSSTALSVSSAILTGLAGESPRTYPLLLGLRYNLLVDVLRLNTCQFVHPNPNFRAVGLMCRARMSLSRIGAPVNTGWNTRSSGPDALTTASRRMAFPALTSTGIVPWLAAGFGVSQFPRL